MITVKTDAGLKVNGDAMCCHCPCKQTCRQVIEELYVQQLVFIPRPGAGLRCEILSMYSCGGIERIACHDRIPRMEHMSDLWVIFML